MPFADTLVRNEDEENVGRGAPSMLYVYEEGTFNPDAQQRPFKHSLGIVVENVIKNHELIHADHFYAGIPSYPSSWFETADKRINRLLFLTVSEIVAHRHEYQGLVHIPRKDAYLIFYQEALQQLALPYFLQLPQLTSNKDLLALAQKERWF